MDGGIPDAQKLHEQLKQGAPAFWRDVLGTADAPDGKAEPRTHAEATQDEAWRTSEEIDMGALAGRVALVTGASRDIGRAIARRFSAEGAAVVLNASRIGRHGNLAGTLEEAVCELQAAGGKAAAVVADLADAGARTALIERAGEAFGPIDVP